MSVSGLSAGAGLYASVGGMAAAPATTTGGSSGAPEGRAVRALPTSAGRAPSPLSDGTLSSLLASQVSGGVSVGTTPGVSSSGAAAVSASSVDAVMKTLRSTQISRYDAVNSLLFPGSRGAAVSASA